jgi:hypothetical protein
LEEIQLTQKEFGWHAQILKSNSTYAYNKNPNLYRKFKVVTVFTIFGALICVYLKNDINKAESSRQGASFHIIKEYWSKIFKLLSFLHLTKSSQPLMHPVNMQYSKYENLNIFDQYSFII